MAASDGKVVIDTQLNNKGFNKGVQGLKSEMGGLNGVIGKIGKTIAGAFAIGAIIQFGKECIELGSDVQEVQNVVDTAFGDMAYKAEEFAATAITQFGMSSLAAKKTSSNYMAMARGMGVVPEAASDMALSLAGLSGDVASFYNLSQEEAATKLAGVFTGESEALKSIGVVMTETNLQAYAMSRGITKSMSAMTQAEKVALRYGFVTDTLAMAQGDFANTSDSWANQTRILSMQFQELMSILGQALITVLRLIVVVLNKIVGYLVEGAKLLGSFINAVFGASESKTQKTGEAASAAIGAATDEQNALTAATKKTAKEQNKAIAGFDEINKLSSGSGSGDDAGGGGGSVDIMKPAIDVEEVEKEASPMEGFFKALFEGIKTSFSDTISSVMDHFGLLKGIWGDMKSLKSPIESWFKSDGLKEFASTYVDAADHVFSGLVEAGTKVTGDVWNNFAFPVIDFGLEEGLPRITALGTELLNTFTVIFDGLEVIFGTLWENVFSPGLSFLATMWTDMWGSIFSFWDTYGAPIFEKFRTAISNFVGIFVNLWEEFLGPAFEKFFSVIGNLWNEHLKPLFDKLGNFIGELITLLLNLWNNILAPIVNWLVDVLGPVFSAIWSGICDVFGWVFGVISDVCGWILDLFSGILSFLNDVFENGWSAVWDGIKNAAGAAWDWIKGIWNGVANWFDETIVRPIANFFGGLWTGIKSAASTLASWIKAKVIDPIVNFFKGLYNAVIGIVEGIVNGFIGIINGFIKGINWVIDAINLIPNVELPHIKTMSKVTIPRLAQGAVIPPNKEFMAVLGDQKSGTNIETPLATMLQAFKQALAESGGGGAQTIVLQIDGREFGRAVKKYGGRENRRIGVSLVGVKG